MSDEDNSRSLIPIPDRSLAITGAGERRILSTMVGESLTLVREETGTITNTLKRSRIGAYEWCEPDYQQIIIWARTLSLTPEEVIHRLIGGRIKGIVEWGDAEWNEWDKTVFSDGRLLRLNWNIDLLPIDTFEWVDGLAITHLALQSFSKRLLTLSPRLPSLTHLLCNRLGLRELNLSGLSNLKCLHVGWEPLTTLDITCVPQLTYLYCGDTQISKLDLSKVPILKWLALESNPLTQLDLSNVPLLKGLHCAANQLTELDLSRVPMLTTLTCLLNAITKLKFPALPMLNELNCWANELTELDLSNTPMLTELDCGKNKLTELNICTLQHLTKLRYDAQATRLIHWSNQDVKRMLKRFDSRE